MWMTTNWKFLRDGNTRPLYCLLRNLYAGQEAPVRTGHGTMDWLKIGKGVCQGLFNLYAESIMWNAGLDESQAGIRHANDGTKWRGIKEPLNKGEKEEWKGWLKIQHSKTKIMASGSITSWKNRWGKRGKQ